jgi:hypothetical protein
MAITPVLAPTALPSGSGVAVNSAPVSGGTLLITSVRSGVGPVEALDTTFIPAAAGGARRYLSLSNAKSDLGVPLTAAAGTPSGTVGISRTAGTSLTLVGEATSSNAKTDKALFQTNLPDSYVANSDIIVTVNSSISGSGTLTAASCTMTVAAYLENNGVETALTVSAAKQIVAAGGDLTFTITGAASGLVPGSPIALEATMLITSSSGVNTGAINAISFVA